jgi:hypothetical protein
MQNQINRFVVSVVAAMPEEKLAFIEAADSKAQTIAYGFECAARFGKIINVHSVSTSAAVPATITTITTVMAASRVATKIAAIARATALTLALVCMSCPVNEQ